MAPAILSLPPKVGGAFRSPDSPESMCIYLLVLKLYTRFTRKKETWKK